MIKFITKRIINRDAMTPVCLHNKRLIYGYMLGILQFITKRITYREAMTPVCLNNTKVHNTESNKKRCYDPCVSTCYEYYSS